MTVNEFTWPSILTQLLNGDSLSVSQAEWVMRSFMRGEATGSQQGAFLAALNAKSVSVQELMGFRDAILSEGERVDLPTDALDIVGTGGDHIGTVNVSTMATLVCAAAGIPMVKHGNRAATSKSGAADILDALGVDVHLPAAGLREVFDRAGIAFVHAARFLPGFRHVASTRKELGIPTVFNFLGPLCNPVRPEASAIGVADARRAPLIAGVFRIRGASALVFRGDDGLDELTTTGHSHIWEVTRGRLTEHDLDPRELGIERARIEDLLGGSPEENSETLHRTFAGEPGPVRDIVTLNAAAGMIAYDLWKHPVTADAPLLERFTSKLRIARDVIDSGAVAAKTAEWVTLTRAYADGSA